MNRKLKFRAWDNVAFQMYFVGEEDDVVFTLDDNGIVATDITQGEEEFQTLHHLQYMQFTGLYDRNGKPIYEGDIVTIQGASKIHTRKIEFEKGTFHFGYVPDGMCEYSEMEVIGNICENPELIKKDHAAT